MDGESRKLKKPTPLNNEVLVSTHQEKLKLKLAEKYPHDKNATQAKARYSEIPFSIAET